MPETSIIFGPPGTGKTSSLKALVERKAREWGGGDRIVLCSFSKAAAVELAERLVDTDVPDANIGTIHALAYRALGRPPLAEDEEGLKAWNCAHPSLRLSATPEKGGGGGVDESSPYSSVGSGGDGLFHQYQLYRAKMIPEEAWDSRVQGFARLWEDYKQQTKRIDFTDMLSKGIEETLYAPGSPSVLVVDEGQDLSKLQAALVLKWSLRCSEVIVAEDDDQTIFQWAGADHRAFLDLSEVKRGYLRQSWRVPVTVLGAAVDWIRQIPAGRREEKEYAPRFANGRNEEDGYAAGAVVRAPRARYMDPCSLLKVAEPYLSAGKYVLFLASCAYMLDPLKAELRKQAIPFDNPYRTRRGDWNPLPLGTRGSGASSAKGRTTAAGRLLSFLLPDEEVWGEQARMWSARTLGEWLEWVEAKGVLRHGAKARLEAMEEEDPHRELSAGEIAGLFADDAAMESAWNGDLAWLERSLLPAKRKTMEFALHVARARGARALMPDFGRAVGEKPRGHQVKIGTIHSVKGGEADVVFLMPDLSRAAYPGWSNRRSEAHDALVRLFYVGMTRARETLVLCGQSSGCAVGWLR